MRILAIDTAMGSCGACVLDAGAPEPVAQAQMVLERGHAEHLMPLIERVMASVPGGFGSLDRIAVTVGPGSFTGLRVGISAARGIGLATGCPVVGVTTLAATCAPWIGGDAGRLVGAALDARHGCVWFQLLDSGGRAMGGPRHLSAKDAVRAIGAGPVNLAGSGALMVAREAWSIGLDALVVDPGPAPDVAWVARLGALANPESAPARALYLREADARPQDGARLALA